MSEYSPIPLRKDTTRIKWDERRNGDKHDQFANKLLAIWDALTPAERAEILARVQPHYTSARPAGV